MISASYTFSQFIEPSPTDFVQLSRAHETSFLKGFLDDKIKYLLLLTALLALPTSLLAESKYFNGYNFQAYVKPTRSGFSFWNSGFKRQWRHGKNILQVREGQEYTIVVHNPLPVRVAAAVTVDGLNTIDGKHTSPARGKKWIIQPHSSISIRGWQTDNHHSRRFYFTREGLSYASWKERKDGRPYTQNLGVIGIAYFWNSSELHHTLYPPRPYHDHDGYYPRGRSDALRKGNKNRSHRSYGSRSEKAGTGMGHREHHSVYNVNFHYDTGMYSSHDAITIHYEFAHYRPKPRPFEDDYSYKPHYRYRGNYAPEMP